MNVHSIGGNHQLVLGVELHWKRFITVFAGTFCGCLAVVAALIALIDPLAISPLRVLSDEIVPLTNRRYIVPSIVRSGRYDSFIVGTSTVHTLDPMEVAKLLPGHYANLALLGSSPYEQSRVVELIARSSHRPGTILWGLDQNWCADNAASARAGPEVLPDWLYDDSGWNDFANVFNWYTLDLVRRKLEQAFRPQAQRVRADGFLHMLPADTAYDADKARKLIYGSSAPQKFEAREYEAPHSSSRQTALRPGPTVLANALDALPIRMRVVLVLMPAHAAVLLPAGSEQARALAECKSDIASVVAKREGWLLDAMWANVWTVNDENYWDGLHYRDHLRSELIAAIAGALTGGASHQSVRVLVRGR